MQSFVCRFSLRFIDFVAISFLHFSPNMRTARNFSGELKSETSINDINANSLIEQEDLNAINRH